jgi:hypothetical protein
LALSPREMRAVVRMELAMRTVYQQGMVNGLPPVSGCWRAAIDRVLERDELRRLEDDRTRQRRSGATA